MNNVDHPNHYNHGGKETIDVLKDFLTEEEFKDYAKYDLYEIIDKCFTIYGTVLGDTIALGLCLGFTLEQLEEAYYKKNKINWDRIANNY